MFENVRSRIFFIFCLIVFLLYGALSLFSTLDSINNLRIHSDTEFYLRTASNDIFSLDFYSERSIGFPLLLKAARGNVQTAAILQTLLSVLSWSTFAYVFARRFHAHVLKVTAFLIILLFSLGHYVNAWDTVMLTESLSLSLLVLMLAGLLWLLDDWTWLKAGLLVGIFLAWAFTRDTNYWLLLSISFFTLIAGIFVSRRWLVLAGICFAIFFLADLASNHAERWIFPFQNVLAARILPDSSAVEFFSSCGMPVTPELLNLAGGNASSNDRAFYNDPQLSSYREWLYIKGKACYLQWLVSRPVESLLLPLQDFPDLVDFKEIDRFYAKRYQPLLSIFLENIVFPPFNVFIVLIGLLILLIVSVFQKTWRQKPLWIVWAGMVILLYPHLFLVWHGDTLGLDRHALTLIVQYFLAIWLALFLVLDWVYEKKRAQ